MGIVKQIVNSFLFWGAWIIIPVIMEIIPAIGSLLLLIKRRVQNQNKEKEKIYYPEISIIVPVYNSQDTLFRCIQSIYHSTYPVECVRLFLVNNQGRDDSFKVYAKCQEKYPKLHMQWLNAEQGKSRALNLALYNSEGKYIINLDSDGVLETSALENMIRKFEQNPNLNCMTGTILTNPSKIKRYKRKRDRLLRKLEFMEYAQAFLAGRSYASEIDAVYTLSGAFSAFRKSAILKSRLYNTDTICEDTQVTFQMRYLYHEKVEICEDAIFLVDPIDDFNKLYTQRQRWQRGSLEVAKMFMDKHFKLSRFFVDVNVKTLLYDHTFAFPRMIWYLALMCLMSMNYSGKVVLSSMAVLFALYMVIGFCYFLTAVFFLRKVPRIQKYYVCQWWCVLLLPFFNLLVFFIRMAGIINSIQTDSVWRTRTLTQEKKALCRVIKADMKKPMKWIRKIQQRVNIQEEAKEVLEEQLIEQKEHGFVWYLLLGSICGISSILFIAGKWVKDNLGVGIQEIIHTLTGDLTGTGGDMTQKVIIGCVLPSVVLISILIVICIWDKKVCNKTYTKVHKNIHRSLEMLVPVVMLVVVLFLNHEYEVLDYVKAKSAQTMIYEMYYVSPNDVEIVAKGKKKNLIYIYIESMEITYASKEVGGKQQVNYIPNLTQMSQEYISFSENDELGGWHSVPGTNWTMAALLSTSSGVPYAMPIKDTELGKQEKYMSGLITLGDVLHQQGYQQQFMCGSDASFAGRNNYFSQHGNYQIFDVYTAKEKGYIPEDYWEWWGYEDAILYDIAKDEVLRMAAESQPFNLTMLTVDMHATGGYQCRLCEDTYEINTANVVSCADRQVAAFVEWCQQQDFYKDTVIVISGDHPRMDSFLVNNLNYYDRTVYNCFINCDIEVKQKERIFTSMDMFPTVLASLGYEIEGERLGLGTNLFSEKKTLVELKGYEWFLREIEKTSSYYVEKFAPEL